MTDYWDAVLGAALELPGTARPAQGPRPLADGEDQDLPVEVEELRDAPLPRASRPPAPQETAPVAAALETAAEPAVPAPVQTRRGATPISEAEPEGRRPLAEPPVVARVAPDSPPAPQTRDDAPPRSSEAPRPIASEPDRAEPARHVPLEAAEPVPAVAASPSLPPAPDGRREAAAAPQPAPLEAEPTTVSAEPLAPATHAPSIGHEAERAALPPLTIEIGRIDVRIDPPAAAPPPIAATRPSSDSVPSLADYLVRRGEAGR